MLRVSKMADYATVIMVFFARHADAEAYSYCSFSAVEVAESTQIALPSVRKVLKLLVLANILTSVRGVNGGYHLARFAGHISLADVVCAIDGPIALTECSQQVQQCHHAEHCVVQPNWRWVNQVVAKSLRAVSIQQMIGQPGEITIKVANVR
ncbi:SUF system Fe-S cluster assembly regulator [Piscirickettsia salmonis]|nr:SUF system Fe-S cluster assembly regulator [Piscirickettsia salmonis]KLV35013.1 feS assembly SUF system regulator [Piscirickettsia salmonis]QHS25863.1 SUF system Fe-S cluster assembly regulator [Piscirickettsia salmonis]QHS29156.1 SUF system Fe-S cluster assembly regulator [Piscirickettsia salmonis]